MIRGVWASYALIHCLHEKARLWQCSFPFCLFVYILLLFFLICKLICLWKAAILQNEILQICPKVWHNYLNSLKFSHLMAHEPTLLTTLQKKLISIVSCFPHKSVRKKKMVGSFHFSFSWDYFYDLVFSFMRYAEVIKCIS